MNIYCSILLFVDISVTRLNERKRNFFFSMFVVFFFFFSLGERFEFVEKRKTDAFQNEIRAILRNTAITYRHYRVTSSLGFLIP